MRTILAASAGAVLLILTIASLSAQAALICKDGPASNLRSTSSPLGDVGTSDDRAPVVPRPARQQLG